MSSYDVEVTLTRDGLPTVKSLFNSLRKDYPLNVSGVVTDGYESKTNAADLNHYRIQIYRIERLNSDSKEYQHGYHLELKATLLTFNGEVGSYPKNFSWPSNERRCTLSLLIGVNKGKIRYNTYATL